MRTSSLPDMGSVGEAASKFRDPGTVVLYFLLVLIVVLVMKDMVGAWRHARIADKFASSADRLAQVMQSDSLQVTVQLALVQRELAEAKDERQEIKLLLTEARDLLARSK